VGASAESRSDAIEGHILIAMNIMNTRLSLWKTTLIAGAASIAANLVVLYFTKPFAPDFMSLSIMPVIFWTVIATLGAAIIFALTRKYAEKPARTFVRISWLAVFLSFFMDIPLFFVDIPFFAGATMGGLIALMSMHAIAFVIIVPTLVNLTKKATPAASSITNI
jgi:hypothetical protein